MKVQQFVIGKTSGLIGDGLRKAVMAITTEAEVFDLVDKIGDYATQQGDYTGALADAALKLITSYGNSFVNETLGMHCQAGI